MLTAETGSSSMLANKLAKRGDNEVCVGCRVMTSAVFELFPFESFTVSLISATGRNISQETLDV